MYSLFSEKLGKENVFLNEPMKNHTTFHIGGVADCFIKCSTFELVALAKNLCIENNIPLFVMGNGSNLLVSDDGIRGVVMQFGDNFCDAEIDFEKHTITAKSGIILSRLASLAQKNGFSGFECISGIPGTLGGALYMNAGAYEDEISNHVVSVTVLDEALNIKTLSNEECDFSYRSSVFMKKDMIILSAVLKFSPENPEIIKSRIQEYTQRRVSKQPIEKHSAGSTFKRPVGNFAGTLIEKSGLKGKTIGGASVSEKHAGFIINEGNATAKDVCKLIEYVQKTVKDKFDVELEPEVKFIGKFD